MDRTFEILGELSSSDSAIYKPLDLFKGFFALNNYVASALMIWLIGFTSPLIAKEHQPAFLNSAELLPNSQQSESYIFDDPVALAKQVNSQLSPILGGLTIRIVRGGILTAPDLQEWRNTMGADKTRKYQQALYMAFAGDVGPISITNIRTTDRNGHHEMNCIISYPNDSWHIIWDIGGVNMSMQYGDKNYNRNDVATFVLYHESKHCLPTKDNLLVKENKSDAFAALMYRAQHNGDSQMLSDIIHFRQHQLDTTDNNDDPRLKRSALLHDSRATLKKVIELDFNSMIRGRSVVELNALADTLLTPF